MTTREDRRRIVAGIEASRNSGVPMKEACEKFGISDGTFYGWRRQFPLDEIQELEPGTPLTEPGSLQDEVRRLRDENAKLRRYVGDQLINRMLEGMSNA